MELVDVPHSKCGGATRAGSSPAIGTSESESQLMSSSEYSVLQKRHPAKGVFFIACKKNPIIEQWDSQRYYKLYFSNISFFERVILQYFRNLRIQLIFHHLLEQSRQSLFSRFATQVIQDLKNV